MRWQWPVFSAGTSSDGASAPRRWLTPGNLAMAAMVGGWVWFFLTVETHMPFTLPAAGVFLGFSALLFALIRRWRLAFVLAMVVFGSIFVSSVFKYSIVAMNLHIYDVCPKMSESIVIYVGLDCNTSSDWRNEERLRGKYNSPN